MKELPTEYTDRRNISHRVEHVIRSDSDSEEREKTLGELYRTLAPRSSAGIDIVSDMILKNAG
jgi:hypothetical protein